jgi:hypothetical protein
MRSQIRRQDLHEHHGRRLTDTVGKPGSYLAIEGPNAASCDNLASATGVTTPVTFLEKIEERYRCVENSSGIDVKSSGEFSHGC